MPVQTLTGTVNTMQDRARPLTLKIEIVPMGAAIAPSAPASSHPVTVIGAAIPQQRMEFDTDDQGHFEIDLWVGDFLLTPYYYRLHWPGHDLAFFLLGGAPIDISEVMWMQQLTLAQIEAMPLSNIQDVYARLLLRLQADREALIDERIREIAGDKTYIHIDNEQLAASVWRVQHNLNKYPSVTTVDSAGNVFEAGVTYLDPNSLEINHGSDMTGKAYCN